jgi:hypothetical protein
MAGMEPAILIVLFVVLVVGLIILAALSAAKRRKELSAWAASRGLSFDPNQQGGFDARFPVFKCLCQNEHRYAYDVMTGQAGGRGVIAFDYHYETHSTDSKGNTTTTDHHFSAVIVASAVPLEPLVIRPEGLFDKIKEFFGVEGIHFESAEFSRKFFVSAPDRKWAYDVIHQRAMEMLMAMPVFHVECDRACVIAYRYGRFKPEDFDAALNVVNGLLDAMPEYLVKQQMGA